jgi:MMP 1-O-methyltransferase
MDELEKVKQIADTIEGFLSFTEEKFLYNAAKNSSKKGTIVEIGSFKGKSTVFLAKGSLAGKKIKIVAIDPHISNLEHTDKKSSYPIFKANLKKAGVAQMVVPIVAKAEDAVKKWKKPISFLWIDGDHSYEGVKKDFDLWSPFVIEGGLIAFHDSTVSDVQKVVGESIISKGFKNVGLADSISYAIKSRKTTLFDILRSKIIYSINLSHNVFRYFIPQNMRKDVKLLLEKVGLPLYK